MHHILVGMMLEIIKCLHLQEFYDSGNEKDLGQNFKEKINRYKYVNKLKHFDKYIKIINKWEIKINEDGTIEKIMIK